MIKRIVGYQEKGDSPPLLIYSGYSIHQAIDRANTMAGVTMLFTPQVEDDEVLTEDNLPIKSFLIQDGEPTIYRIIAK